MPNLGSTKLKLPLGIWRKVSISARLLSHSSICIEAEKANVPVTSLVKSINHTDADEAALWLSYITAYEPFIEYENMQPGQSALITAASSAVGLAAIQIVKDRGGIAIATTRTSAKRQALLDAVQITSLPPKKRISLHGYRRLPTGTARLSTRFNCSAIVSHQYQEKLWHTNR
jgi:hypothetical protein